MLRDKYQSLIAMAESNGVADLKIQEQDNVLHIDGTAPRKPSSNSYGMNIIVSIRICAPVTLSESRRRSRQRSLLHRGGRRFAEQDRDDSTRE